MTKTKPQRRLVTKGPSLLVSQDTFRHHRSKIEKFASSSVFEIEALDINAGATGDDVTLIVRDLAELRRLSVGRADLGKCRRFTLRTISDEPLAALLTGLQLEGLLSIEAGSKQSSDLRLSFNSPAPVRIILEGLGRSPGRPEPRPSTALVGWLPSCKHRMPGAPNSVIAGQDSEPLDPRLPTSLDVLVETSDDLTPRTPGSTPRVTLAPEFNWADADSMPSQQLSATLAQFRGTRLAPVDLALINPSGFKKDPRRGIGDLIPDFEAPHVLSVRTANEVVARLDSRTAPSVTAIEQLRDLRGLRLHWRGAEGPTAYCQVVAALAVAGVPLISSGPVPYWARTLIHSELLLRIANAARQLDDDQTREEHSLRQRRAALSAYGSSWWPHEAHLPEISVVLCTKRPSMLAFALRQIARQQQVNVETVLVCHGFSTELEEVKRAIEGHVGPVVALSVAEEVSFGEALNFGAEAASGELLAKMDDDDWYGPWHLADAAMALAYSGADLVGAPAEYVFLQSLWHTIRRRSVTENYGTHVAGGTLLLPSGAFREVGGFRSVPRSVDLLLLDALMRAGGTVYRTHGLNYVLRRTSSGHTWDPGLAYFVRSRTLAAQWRGFRPSGVVEVSDEDAPRRLPRGEVVEATHE